MESGETRRSRGYVYDGTKRIDRPEPLDTSDDVVVGGSTKILFNNRAGGQVEDEYILIPIKRLVPSHSKS